MPRRFFPRRRFASKMRSRTVPRWTAQATDMTLTAAAPASFVTLYNPGTVIGAGTYEEEVKLVRVVGRLTVSTLAATAAAGPVGLGILKTTAGITAGGINDPFVANELAARDWLWVGNTQAPPNAGANGWMRDYPLDIKVQRRMKAEEALRLVAIQGLGVDSVVITIDVRILVVIRL